MDFVISFMLKDLEGFYVSAFHFNVHRYNVARRDLSLFLCFAQVTLKWIRTKHTAEADPCVVRSHVNTNSYFFFPWISSSDQAKWREMRVESLPLPTFYHLWGFHAPLHFFSRNNRKLAQCCDDFPFKSHATLQNHIVIIMYRLGRVCFYSVFSGVPSDHDSLLNI